VNEFEIIERFFRPLDRSQDRILLGIGDDAAIVSPSREALVVCTDTLVCGVHFSADDPAPDIGFKSLAVNLSDLAAMGAQPCWATLNLTLPEIDENWLGGFCRGFDELAARYPVSLIGGDTTRGPLTVSIQVGGYVPKTEALKRSGAVSGQRIFLSAPVGDGALGLKVARGEYAPGDMDRDYLLARLRRPEPAIDAGLEVRRVASAAIDISDGLVADLQHVLDASGGLGADLVMSDKWFSAAAARYLLAHGTAQILIDGGDDYVLLFTVDARIDADELKSRLGFDPIEIGEVVDTPGIRITDKFGNPVSTGRSGYRHFD
jgi:thiamine-monophosphate kinase